MDRDDVIGVRCDQVTKRRAVAPNDQPNHLAERQQAEPQAEEFSVSRLRGSPMPASADGILPRNEVIACMDCSVLSTLRDRSSLRRKKALTEVFAEYH